MSLLYFAFGVLGVLYRGRQLVRLVGRIYRRVRS